VWPALGGAGRLAADGEAAAGVAGGEQSPLVVAHADQPGGRVELQLPGVFVHQGVLVTAEQHAVGQTGRPPSTQCTM
jgi:hypothetical protein